MLCAVFWRSSGEKWSASGQHAVPGIPLLMLSSTTSVIFPRLPEPLYTNSCENAWMAALIKRVCSSGAAGFISEGYGGTLLGVTSAFWNTMKLMVSATTYTHKVSSS